MILLKVQIGVLQKMINKRLYKNLNVCIQIKEGIKVLIIIINELLQETNIDNNNKINMSIINKDGFDFYSDINNNPESFIIKGIDLNKEIAYIIDNNIKSISLSCFESKSIESLQFLEKINFIEKVSLDNINIELNSLYVLKNLKELIISVINKKQFLDYSMFPNLEILSIDWYSKFPSLSKNNNLKELSIWKFKPKSKSLKELFLPESLEKLHITESNIINLEGLESNNLKIFEAHYCNSLESIKGINKFSNNLGTFILDYCRKLVFYDDLKYAKNLNKLILGDCGDIPNLNWLSELKKLEHFSFLNTKLINGDTSYCFFIKYVNFKNENYYNYKKEDFKTNQ